MVNVYKFGKNEVGLEKQYHIFESYKNYAAYQSFFHTHEFFELELIIDGSSHQILNGIRYPLYKGVIYMTIPPQSHKYCVEKGEEIHMYTAHFNGAFLSKNVYEQVGKQLCVAYLEQDEYSYVENALKVMNHLQHLPAAQSDNIIRSILDSVCLMMCSRLTTKIEDLSSQDIRIDQIISYVNQNYSKKLCVSDIAERFSISPNYLGKIFHDKIGYSLLRYIKQLRLNEAMKRITFTDDKFEYIAYCVGYRSYAGFSRDFKELFGKSPMDYRKKAN